MTNLSAPERYYELKEQGALGSICNGMGAANSALSRFIPNTMYGLDVEEGGNIHDFRYNEGQTEQHKIAADLEFLCNMVTQINEKGGFLGPMRRRRAMKYYEAVHYKGGAAFWADKKD